jgi:hypothetical protein
MQSAYSTKNSKLVHEFWSAIITSSGMMLLSKLQSVKHFEVYNVMLCHSKQPRSGVNQPLIVCGVGFGFL